MKTKYFLYLVISMFFTIGCSSNKQSEDSLPCIDLRNNYPEKEIILSDIADITYVHLNTKDDDYLYKGFIRYATANTIVLPDMSSGAILFFDKDGNPKSRFNHYGEGPQEYIRKGIDIETLIYDELADEVVIGYRNTILVYSSTGEYKRKIVLPQGIRAWIVDFDNQSYFVYDEQKQFKKLIRETSSINQLNDSIYFRISKTDGRVLDYVIVPNNDAIDITDCDGENVLFYYGNIRICDAGLLLCNPETDTVFLYQKDKSLIPFFCKKPLVNNTYPKVILGSFMDAGRYQFITISKPAKFMDFGKYPNEYYVRDKQTDEIFHQKVILKDYKGKELFISNLYNICFDGKDTFFWDELNLIELKKANREGRLSGKLKELVATLNENKDNNVFMLARFK